jgi:signal transduction histidine kinase
LQLTPLAGLLQHAIEALASRGEIAVESSLDASDAVDPPVRVQLYRIAQEALSNVARHSGARHCRIEWGADERGARLRIADDGAGFDVDVDRPGHFGLDNMRSRAQEIGASLSLTSRSGEGTEVRIEWSAGQP